MTHEPTNTAASDAMARFICQHYHGHQNTQAITDLSAALTAAGVHELVAENAGLKRDLANMTRERDAVSANWHSIADELPPADGGMWETVTQRAIALRLRATAAEARAALLTENIAVLDAAQQGWAQSALDNATRLAECSQNDARYRWLRECSWFRSDRTMYVHRNVYENGKLTRQESPDRDYLDSIIDAAIATADAAAGRVG